MRLRAPDELGMALRAMIADDARWALDMVLSAQRADGDLGNRFPMLLLGHNSRVVYEGSNAIRDAAAGRTVQPLVDLIPPESSPVIVAARHATKLVEGIRNPAASLEEQMRLMLKAHRDDMFGQAPIWMRPTLPELSVLSIGDTLLGVSPALQFQFGVPAEIPPSELSAVIFSTAREQGGTLLVLAALDLDTVSLKPLEELTGTLDMADLEIRMEDCRSADLVARYASQPSDVGAVVLALIEGNVNTALEALRHGAETYPGPVFRARFLTLTAALESLGTLSGSATASRIPVACVKLIADPRTRAVQRRGGPRRLRNTLMHYGFDREDLELESERPLLGLVEAVGAANSFEELNVLTQSLLTDLAEALRSA